MRRSRSARHVRGCVCISLTVAGQMENVVRIKTKGERVLGTFLLFATHFIYVDANGDEIWVR